MTAPVRPPKVIDWLLHQLLPAESADLILGDLTEQLHERAAARGGRTWVDQWWALGEGVRSLTPSTIHSLQRRRHPHPLHTRGQPMATFWQDIRFAFRSLRGNPMFVLLTTLTIATGIGATTVVYSAVEGLVLRPFPFPEPGRLIGVGAAFPRLGGEVSFFESLSPAEYADIKRSKNLERVVAWDLGNRQVTFGEQTENLFSGFWWGDAFATLAMPPALGRGFSAEELSRGTRVAILSHRVWQDRFGADSTLVGQRILVNGDPYSVVGIMPPKALIFGTDLWLPMPVGPEVFPRNRRQFQVMGRLASGATLGSLQAELDVIARQVEHEFGPASEEYRGWRLQASTWNDINVASLKTAAWVLVGAVAFVMLLVCTNVATLLLGRLSARSRELAIRVALGAGRLRLHRQLLTESLVLATLGAAVGMALGALGVSALGRTLASLPIPIAGTLAIDGRVVGAAVAAALMAGLLFGTLPAWQVLRQAPHGALMAEVGQVSPTRSRLRLHSWLVAIEAALAIMLVASGGYLLRSLARLQSVDPGLATENVLTMRLSLARERYPAAAVQPFFAALRDRVKAIPGVVDVATASQLPPRTFLRTDFSVEGAESTNGPAVASAFSTQVSPEYFAALGVPVVAGRAIAPTDRSGTPLVVVINSAAASRFFPGKSALGSRLRVFTGADTVTAEIVGVAGATRNVGLDRAAEPELYWPSAQGDGLNNQFLLAVRTNGNPRAVLAPVREAIRGLDPDQPVYAVQTMEEAFDNAQFQRRLSVKMLTLFAGFALIIAAVGIYGVVGYAASLRTREIGLRMALGASRLEVAGLFLRQAFLPVTIGAAVGLAAAVGTGRLMAGLMYQVEPGDPFTLVASALALAAVGITAGFIPARRASRVDPVEALRAD